MSNSFSLYNETGKTNAVVFRFSKEISMQQHKTEFHFTNSMLKKTKVFIEKMEKSSCRCHAYRGVGNNKKVKQVNRGTYRFLKKYGRSLFRKLKKAAETQGNYVNTFEDLFGKSKQITLKLDDETHSIPWELTFDGTDFLCSKYSIGRIINVENWIRESGELPQFKEALVVGLNYSWDKPAQLYTPESEALMVSRRLEKLGYEPILLRGDKATKKEVKQILSNGVSVFHFTGHGIYHKNQPKGKRGRLSLRDEDLSEEDLESCFSKAKGAPYFSFLNACQSAEEVYNTQLMDAFKVFGAESCIGTLWSIYDNPAKELAIKFYDEAVKGANIGDSLFKARNSQVKSRSYAKETTWPALVLYGHPNIKLHYKS